MKKLLAIMLAVATLFTFAACGATEEPAPEAPAADSAAEGEASEEAAPAAIEGMINAFTREEGSGTRGAFIEILGIEVDGNDTTSKEIPIAPATDIVMTSVAGDPNSLGYISMGSVNDTIKAISVDGAEPTAENVQNGSYPISRPFNIATKGAPTELAQDFINFIMSDDGQAVVSEDYIPVTSTGAYTATPGLSGTISVGGSTSVAPVMEVLAEAYMAINADVKIEIQATGSSAGMTGAMDGTLDIGMASRGLKDSELAELTPAVMAIDGIAIIVNNENPISNVTQEQVKSIYVGDVIEWSELQE